MKQQMSKTGNLIGRRGLMLVLSSPSGAGKTSIARRLLEEDTGIEMSISATTRKRRPGEVEGRDYRFVDRSSFHIMINNREFLEYAKVFDHYYGTPEKAVMNALESGRDVLFDIDWQGTKQIVAEFWSRRGSRRREAAHKPG